MRIPEPALVPLLNLQEARPHGPNADAERAQLAMVFELSPSFLALLRGPDHVFELTNPAYDTLVGNRPVVGLPVRDALPEVVAQGFAGLLDGVYRNAAPFVGKEVPLALRPHPGAPLATKFVDFVYQPIREADGTVVGIFVSGNDVTEQVLARRRAEGLAERYRLVVESTSDIIWDWERESGRVTWSHAELQDIGVMPNDTEALIAWCFAHVHPDDLERLAADIGILSAEAPPARWVGEFRLRRRDAGYKTMFARASIAHDASGRMVRMVGAVRDVTFEREAEARSREAQRLLAVGTLAGGVAHEVNNLMTLVIGFGELALGRLEAGTRTHADLQEILKAGMRAAEVTRQLLAFSRRQVLVPTLIDLEGLLAELAGSLQDSLGAERHLVITGCPGCTIRADRAGIERVLQNLVANARDATQPGGTVTIELSWGPHPVPGMANVVSLVVRDTGHGISPDIRSRIFEPFFTTRPIGRGTGLGLSVVLGIVQQSGGTIDVSSAPDQGATFLLTFPRVAQAPPSKSEGEGGC